MEKREKKKQVNKYAVKPPKELVSKYEAKLAAKKMEEEELKERKRSEEEAARITVIHFEFFLECNLHVPIL